MQRRYFLLFLLFAASGYAGGHKKLSKKKCVSIKQRIRRLESRLRQGHSGQQGRTMKRQVRELQLKRFRQCR